MLRPAVSQDTQDSASRRGWQSSRGGEISRCRSPAPEKPRSLASRSEDHVRSWHHRARALWANLRAFVNWTIMLFTTALTIGFGNSIRLWCLWHHRLNYYGADD